MLGFSVTASPRVVILLAKPFRYPFKNPTLLTKSLGKFQRFRGYPEEKANLFLGEAQLLTQHGATFINKDAKTCALGRTAFAACSDSHADESPFLEFS